MKIAVHLSGVAIAYETEGGAKSKERVLQTGRPQGSLLNQQKRAIADAVEYMRRSSLHKPLIFVATSPGHTHAANEMPILKKFTQNLRNGYGLKDYVWVREVTKLGYPHFHFVACLPWIKDPVGLSLYWSGLFGSDSNCSIRLGSKPQKNGKRLYYIQDQRHANYLCKYLGKDLGTHTTYLAEAGFPQVQYKKSYRSFAISEQARLMSQPIVYEASYHFNQPDDMVLNAHGQYVQRPASCIGRSFEDDAGRYFHPNAYEWKQPNALHAVFFGKMKPNQMKLSKKKAQSVSQPSEKPQ